ncbi:MAG: hypothetical protein J0H68_06890 [Sphingobacteriia bacterium]|nr:hypothetical protein [Sphingobacteriia bacterium]
MLARFIKRVVYITLILPLLIIIYLICSNIYEVNENKNTLLKSKVISQNIDYLKSLIINLSLERTEGYINLVTDDVYNIKLFEKTDFKYEDILASFYLLKTDETVVDNYIKKIKALSKKKDHYIKTREVDIQKINLWLQQYTDVIQNISNLPLFSQSLDITELKITEKILNDTWHLILLIDLERALVTGDLFLQSGNSSTLKRDLKSTETEISKYWNNIHNLSVRTNDENFPLMLANIEKMYFYKFLKLKQHALSNHTAFDQNFDYEKFLNVSQEALFKFIELKIYLENFLQSRITEALENYKVVFLKNLSFLLASIVLYLLLSKIVFMLFLFKIRYYINIRKPTKSYNYQIQLKELLSQISNSLKAYEKNDEAISNPVLEIMNKIEVLFHILVKNEKGSKEFYGTLIELKSIARNMLTLEHNQKILSHDVILKKSVHNLLSLIKKLDEASLANDNGAQIFNEKFIK